ncbi:MAG: glycosyltransferase family 39 protein [Anaerolineales bacterium]|nr:glycosyltransferase family 39 protein [Anaerolineales bacterium]
MLSTIKHQKIELILLGLLPIIVLLTRLSYFDKPLDDDSAANAYGGRLILQGEPLYSSYHPGHHLPLIYYINALAFSLWGDNPWAIRFFLALWLIPAAYLFYYLARTFADRKTSWIALFLFLLLTSDYVMEGHTAEIELFANLPRIASIFLLLIFQSRNTKDWQYVWIGLIGAVCILFKAVYVSALGVTGLILLIQFWAEQDKKDGFHRLIRRAVWMGLGLLMGLLPVVIYFGTLGLLPRLSLVFTLGQDHVNSTGVNPLFLFLYPLSGLAIANLPLLTLGLAGALLMPFDKTLPRLTKYIILLWFVLSFIEAGISYNAFWHYYLLIIPPLSLLAAWFIMQPLRLAQGNPKLKWAGWAIPALFLLTIGATYLFVNSGYLYHYARYKTGQETYRDFVLKSWPPTGPMFVALQDIAVYIQSHSQPDDRIYIWSEETQLYFLANRRCAVDFIWPMFLENPNIPGGPAELQQQLFAPTTKFIIIAQDNPPVWLTRGLTKDYRLVETIAGRAIYQRNH